MRHRDLIPLSPQLAPGALNAITDVEGVRVGHHTLISGDAVRTGVTAILPHDGNIFREKVAAGGREVSAIVWNRREHDFNLAAGEPVNVRMATYYYPHWQINVNGNPVRSVAAADGALTFEAPAEESKVAVKFTEPPVNVAAQYLSLLGVLALLLMSAGNLILYLRSAPGNLPRSEDKIGPQVTEQV